MSIALVIVMYATWSSVFSIGKIALAYCPPLFLTGARMTLAGILLLLFLACTKKLSLRLSGKQMLAVGALAFFCIYLTNILEFWGLQYLSAAKTCFIYSLSPFFAALLSYLHFKEKMTPAKWGGLLIGFTGFLPVLFYQTGSEELFNAFAFFSWPTLAIVGAALFSVYGWVVLRLVVKNESMSPLLANGISMFLGGLLAFVHSFLVEDWSPTPIAPGGILPFFKWTILMTFLFNILCYNLYGALLKRYTATFLSFVGLLSPVFASLNGWLFLGEPLSPAILISTAIVSFGLWIVYREELKQGYYVSQA